MTEDKLQTLLQILSKRNNNSSEDKIYKMCHVMSEELPFLCVCTLMRPSMVWETTGTPTYNNLKFEGDIRSELAFRSGIRHVAENSTESIRADSDAPNCTTM